MKLVTPIKKAKQLGSAKSGFSHWWAQRVSAVALIFLIGWALYAAYALTPLEFNTVSQFFALPLNALVAILLLGTLFYHGYLGIQVVIEDYVHCECAKIGLLIGLKLASIFAAAAGIFSVITIYFLG